jgi:hypothetical protein
MEATLGQISLKLAHWILRISKITMIMLLHVIIGYSFLLDLLRHAIVIVD